MDTLEKVELVREKTGVSYQEAKEALEATGYDVLDAIIYLEQAGKADTRTASYETKATGATKTTSLEMREAQEEYHRTSKKSKIGELWSNFCTEVKRLLNEGMNMTFVAERNGERSLALPLLLVVLGIFFWGATIWLLILGLFFGFRYHIEGAHPVTIDVNNAMNKAAEVAEDIKGDFASKKAARTASPEAPTESTEEAPEETAADEATEE